MSKKTLTDEELFAQFEDIPSATPDTKRSTDASGPDIDDPLAELSALAAARPPVSRPETPAISSSTTTSGTNRRIETPAGSSPPSARTSGDKSRDAKVLQPAAPAAAAAGSQDQPSESYKAQTKTASGSDRGGGGWWGSVFNVASAAVTQASAAVSEIRANEEALKWAEQVRSNVEKAKAYGDNVRSLALPAFTNILQTIAPPISAHERLLIHTSYDIVGYPSMDPLVYAVFARVMSQVEGGDLLVIQRGRESRVRGRSGSEAAYKGSSLGSSAGWTDGPWWRDTAKRDLGAIKGLVEGTKLSRASAEAYAQEFFATKGGVEAAAKQATEIPDESNPVRTSDIFLSIQPISGVQRDDLFASGPKKEKGTGVDAVDEPDTTDSDASAFAIYLYDPVHSISCSTTSQSFPTKWTEWLDTPGPTETEEGEEINGDDDESDIRTSRLPETIRQMIESGGIDPREWAAEWIEEILSLAVGVVAQSYVAKRMGVGAGAIARGKARIRAEEGAAGEAARAGVI